MPVFFFKHRGCPAVDPEFNLLPQAEGRLPSSSTKEGALLAQDSARAPLRAHV